jgi:hypothetical protein
MLDMMDLSKFTWPETCSTTEPRNLSQWREGIDVIEGLKTETGTETEKAAIVKMKFFVDRGLSVRIGIMPRGVGEALIYVVPAPVSLNKLTDILDKKEISGTNPLIPTVGVKASQTGNKHPSEVKYVPSERSLGVSGTGWGLFPLLYKIGPDLIEYPVDTPTKRNFGNFTLPPQRWGRGQLKV